MEITHERTGAANPMVLEKQLAASFGIEVKNLPADALHGRAAMNVRELVLKHKLVVIRAQDLTNAQLFELAQRLGRPAKYAFSKGVEGFPEIIEIRRHVDQLTALSTMWHADSTYLQAPPDFTILYGVESPPFGGNTAFSDTAAAFADLSAPLQDFLRRHRIVNRSDVHSDNERLSHLSMPTEVAALEALHPAAHTNSETGVESIYVNEEHSSHFEGMSRQESKPIINFLINHITQDKYRVDVNWQPKTVLISDNRSTQHRAIDNYYGHSRILRRIIVSATAAR